MPISLFSRTPIPKQERVVLPEYLTRPRLTKSIYRLMRGFHGAFEEHYEVSLSQMLHDILGHDNIQ